MKKFNKISAIIVILVTVILIGIIIFAAVQRGKETGKPSADTTGQTETTVPNDTTESDETTNTTVFDETKEPSVAPITDNPVTTAPASDETVELDVNIPRNPAPTVIDGSIETGTKGDINE